MVAKRVESFLTACLDEGSTPSSSTKQVLKDKPHTNLNDMCAASFYRKDRFTAYATNLLLENLLSEELLQTIKNFLYPTRITNYLKICLSEADLIKVDFISVEFNTSKSLTSFSTK